MAGSSQPASKALLVFTVNGSTSAALYGLPEGFSEAKVALDSVWLLASTAAASFGRVSPASAMSFPVGFLVDCDAARPALTGYMIPTTCPSGSAKRAMVVSGATSVSGMITLPPSSSTLRRVADGSSAWT